MRDAESKMDKNAPGSKEEPHKVTVGNKTVDWPKKTITTEEIAEIGGLNVSDGIVATNGDTERDLKPGEEIDLDKENKFGKDHKFKRGGSRGNK